MQELVNKIKEQVEVNGDKMIYLCLYGSKLYGLDTPKSDSDYIGIFIPSLDSIKTKTDKDFLSFDTNKDGKNTSEDNDIKLFSIYKFFDLIRKGDGQGFDILFSMFSDKFIYSTKESEILRDNYKKLLSKRPESFVGFALQQANKYSVKGERYNLIIEIKEILKQKKFKKVEEVVEDLLALNSKFVEIVEKEEGKYISILNRLFVYNMTKEEFYSKISRIVNLYGERTKKAIDGVDFKAFSHAFRAISEVKELLDDGFITLPIKEREFIFDVKEGKYKDLKMLSEELDKRIDELSISKDKSSLPEYIKMEDINELLLMILR